MRLRQKPPASAFKHHDWVDAACAGAPETEALFPWREIMDACPHDPIYHAEGSPLTHTRMVVSALESEIEKLNIPHHRAEILRVAAWAHDIGKPATTQIEFVDGIERVRQPGHAGLGARMIWQYLIDSGRSPCFARDVTILVAWHMIPSHMMEESDAKIMKRLVRYAAEAGAGSWSELLALCRSDQNGRKSLHAGIDRDKLLPLQLLEAHIEEISAQHDHDFMSRPWPFRSDQAQLNAIRGNGSLYHTPFDAPKSRVTIMSGLPGSGKDHWIAENMTGTPVVSLDEIRADMKIKPTENQSAVVQAAFEQARAHLRAERDFIWNATCVSRITREKIVGLCSDYGALIRFVSLDVPLDTALQRNASREDPVPKTVMEALALKREPIRADEAHQHISVDADGMETVMMGREETRAEIGVEPFFF